MKKIIFSIALLSLQLTVMPNKLVAVKTGDPEAVAVGDLNISQQFKQGDVLAFWLMAPQVWKANYKQLPKVVLYLGNEPGLRSGNLIIRHALQFDTSSQFTVAETVAGTATSPAGVILSVTDANNVTSYLSTREEGGHRYLETVSSRDGAELFEIGMARNGQITLRSLATGGYVTPRSWGYPRGQLVTTIDAQVAKVVAGSPLQSTISAPRKQALLLS